MTSGPHHAWDVPPREAVAIQRRLAPLARAGQPVRLEDVHTVAGIDASYREVGRAAVVVLSFPALAVVEQAVAMVPSAFPYVPGLLSFREGPVALAALAQLRARPDLLMFDSQGYAHPRRLGLASHIGLLMDLPSIGCAKSRLVGQHEHPGPALGDRAPLVADGETLGMVVRSRPGTRPLFISPGYRMDLETAVTVVLRCLRGYRLPEPTRLADRLAAVATPPMGSAPNRDN
jgi:deoxyribonuclease V